jgi:glutathione S-transferase
MVLKLHTNPQSTCGRRAAVILHEKQVPYELVEADWSVIKTPEWLKNQPFGQVPYIDVSSPPL